jgi:O-antigen/teichoic acid export membrane protein
VALLAGLLANIGLNLLLFPQFGLNGTVCATAASMFLAMALVYVLSWWQGLQLDHRVWYTSVIPCLLGLGGMWGGVLLLFVIALALRGQFLLSDEEKQTVNVTIIAGWEKVKRRFLPMIAA